MDKKNNYNLFPRDRELDQRLLKEPPPILYHYTSLETLSKIFESNQIRFNRLDKVRNDPLEGLSSDLLDAKTCAFVTCFTAKKAECVRFWESYTGDMKGVRIEFPKNPFSQKFPIPLMQIHNLLTIEINTSVKIHRKGYDKPYLENIIWGPSPVIYINPQSKGSDEFLKPTLGRKYSNSQIEKNILYRLGISKTDKWYDEEEWRFRIFALPVNMGFLQSESNNIRNDLLDLKKFPIEETSIYVPLKKDIFNSTSIILGPKATKNEEKQINDLIKQHNLNINWNKSQISTK